MYESPEQTAATYEAKGIETVRRDGCPAVGKVWNMFSVFPSEGEFQHNYSLEDTFVEIKTPLIFIYFLEEFQTNFFSPNRSLKKHCACYLKHVM